MAPYRERGQGPLSPQTLTGSRDLPPDEMLTRNAMIESIRGVLERYAFVPMQTPAIEPLDFLYASTSAEARDSIFRVLGPEKENAKLGLRYELTPSLARFIINTKNWPRPFRRYQVSPVWRVEEPGQGRFREFTQFDFDSVGASSEVADTEIVAAMCDVLDELRIGPYRVGISSRPILASLLEHARVPQTQRFEVIKALDKLPKVGWEKVRLELTTGGRDDSGAIIRGLQLSQVQIDRIAAFFGIKGDCRADVIAELGSFFVSSVEASEAIAEIDRISRNLAALGYGDDRVRIDLTIVRGLAYYTGPIFEAVALEAPQFGSILAGGRYDELVFQLFGERIPATGASIGVDRLLDMLRSLGHLKNQRSTAQVLVTNLESKLTSQYLQMTWDLRRAHVRTELYVGSETSGKDALAAQLKYADEWGIPLVVIYGMDEHRSGTVTLKSMTDPAGTRRQGPQVTVPRESFIDTVKQMLKALSEWLYEVT